MKINNRYELDPERLATTDENGNRVYLYPEDVTGFWKSRRTIFYWFLILLYLALPWFYINGKPALFIDITHREFTVLGFTLHGVEPILFFLILATGLFLIAFMTSLFGRVWCGWACPQTVFIQTIFSKVETLIEGKSRERRALDEAPWSLAKIIKKILKWGAFTIMSLHISHTFIGYFVGPRELFFITMNSPLENLGIFTATMIVSAIVLFDFGWFREQFCIIACPYGRMQSVMMDENSLVVSYNVKRGEPRRGSEGIDRTQEGDCINCYNCVKVCPTGIDIRRGNQLECISCTLCIDACDDIMRKLKKPEGLIKYSSENELLGKGRKIVTKRSVLYLVIACIFLGLFTFFFQKSTNLQLVFLRSKTPFTVQQMSDGQSIIMNHFTLNITHQGSTVHKARFELTDPQLRSKIQIITPRNPLMIDKNLKRTSIFFKFSPDILVDGVKKVELDIFDENLNTVISKKEVVLVGPIDSRAR